MNIRAALLLLSMGVERTSAESGEQTSFFAAGPVRPTSDDMNAEPPAQGRLVYLSSLGRDLPAFSLQSSRQAERRERLEIMLAVRESQAAATKVRKAARDVISRREPPFCSMLDNMESVSDNMEGLRNFEPEASWRHSPSRRSSRTHLLGPPRWFRALLPWGCLLLSLALLPPGMPAALTSAAPPGISAALTSAVPLGDACCSVSCYERCSPRGACCSGTAGCERRPPSGGGCF